MIRKFAIATRKTSRLALRAGRKLVSKPGEALLLCRMAGWVSILSVTAKWCPLPRALRIVSGDKQVTSRAPTPNIQDRLARSIDLLLSADVLFFKPICWKRAAVLRRYLSQNGVATRIVFGVRNEPGGKVMGHAWLEEDGKPILESAVPNYTVTYSFPSHDRGNLNTSQFQPTNNL
jgi:hypothetical protein